MNILSLLYARCGPHYQSLAALTLVSLLLASPLAGATVLGNEEIYSGFYSFGERPPGLNVATEYYAQTFSVPAADNRVDRIGFWIHNGAISPYMGYDTSGSISLRVLLTTIRSDATGFHPDQVVFESDAIVVPHKLAGAESFWDYIDVDVPQVQLQPSVQHAFILDAASDLNLHDNIYAWGPVASTQGYTPGEFWNTRVNWEKTGGSLGTRSEHFAQTWYGYPAPLNYDIAFRVTLVPEPPSYILALFTVSGLCLAITHRRRVRKAIR